MKTILATCVLTGALLAQNNTLVILADDMGIDQLKLYKLGKDPAPTPNLEALAKNGVVFTNAYSTPACTPTRAAIHTGRHGFRYGVLRAGQTLPLAETTLPEILGKTGFATACIGKWHLGGNRAADTHPNQTGWQHFAGSLPGFLNGTDSYTRWRRVVNGTAATSTTYATTQNVNDALAWIGSQTKPWICIVNFNAPHTPLHVPPSALHTYNLTGKNPRREPIPFLRAMVQAMDTEIGRLVKGLGTAASKTNIVFMGDNGTEGRFHEPPFRSTHAKFTCYEGGIQVPLIVNGPIVQSPGREVDSLVSAVDLFSTILDLAGIDPKKAVPANTDLDGVSFASALKSTAKARVREYVYTELRQGRNTDLKAVRNERYKLLRKGTTTEELYDLSTDRFETKDLVARGLTAAEKKQRDELAAELDRLAGKANWYAFGTGCAGTAGTPSLSATNTPRLGQTLSMSARNLGASAVALGFLGFSDDKFAGVVPLPLDLTGAGMRGCSLYVSLDLTFALAVTSGASTWQLPIPNDADLRGLRLYFQTLALDARANTFGAVLSNAGQGTLERN